MLLQWHTRYLLARTTELSTAITTFDSAMSGAIESPGRAIAHQYTLLSLSVLR